VRLLIVGDGQSLIHERAFHAAAIAQGIDASLFTWRQFFSRSLVSRAQEKVLVGPIIGRINRELIRAAEQFEPDLSFLYRGTLVLPATLERLRGLGVTLFGYSNDDPFSPYQRREHRHFFSGIERYHHLFAYRLKNLRDYAAIGVENVSLLRSYFIESLNYPIENLQDSPYRCDVLFAGHFEPDGRDEMLAAILSAHVDLKVVGPEWHRAPRYAALKSVLGPAPRGEAYNLALNSAAIALVFLSRINNDTYTRRCFEIPAAATFMLAQHSDDLAELFTEGREAEYFRSSAELVEKIRYYLAHPDEREQIAAAGRARLLRDGHEVGDRLRQVMQTYSDRTFDKRAHNSHA